MTLYGLHILGILPQKANFDSNSFGILFYLGLGVFLFRHLKKQNLSLRTTFFHESGSVVAIQYIIVLVLIAVTFSLSAGFLVIGLLTLVAPKFLEGIMKLALVDSASSNPVNDVIRVLLICAIAPVIEEIVFRGILFRKLAVRYGNTLGILGSSLIFGLFHYNVLGVGFTGMILCVLYSRTRSLKASVLVHALNNSFALLLGFFVSLGPSNNNKDLQELITSPLPLIFFSSVSLVVLGFAGYHFVLKKYYWRNFLGNVYCPKRLDVSALERDLDRRET